MMLFRRTHNSMRISYLFAAAAALLACPIVLGQSQKPFPPINARIQASWNAAPLLVQILETVSIESPESFFPLLDSLTSQESPDSKTSLLSTSITESALFDQTFTLLDSLDIPISRSSASLASLKLALAVREASPLIETHYSIYKRDLGIYTDGDQEAVQADAPWFVWNGQTEGLQQDILRSADASAGHLLCGEIFKCPKIYPFDHVLETPGSDSDHADNVVLYADPTDRAFPALHSLFTQYAQAGKIRYILRWRPSHRHAQKKLVLSGYGAGLDLKRVDYLTIDDRDLASGSSTGSSDGDTGSAATASYKAAFTESSEGAGLFDDGDMGTELVQLKPAQLTDLGLKASQIIASSADPLASLRRMSQDFPKYAHRLATQWVPGVNESLRAELEGNNAQFVEGGRSLVWLNGLPLTLDEMKPLSLLRLMRRERKTMQALVDLGLTSRQAVDILSHRDIGAASAAPPPPGRGMLSAQHLGELFDASDRPEAASHSEASEGPAKTAETILYWNDIERDSRYRQWPKSMQALLSPMYPGQMPQIRRNLVTVILALDLGKRDVHTILSENIATFISRGVGIRFGTVPLLERADLEEGDNVQAMVARVMWYLVDKAGRASAIAFSRELAKHPDEALDMQAVRKAYEATVRHAQNLRKANPENAPELYSSLNLVLSADLPEVDEKLSRAVAYTERLGLNTGGGEDTLGHFFVNGKLFPLDEEFTQNIQQTMGTHIQYLTQQLYLQEIDDLETDIGNYFYDLPGSYGSRKAFVFPDEDKNPLRIIDVAEMEEIIKTTAVSAAGTRKSQLSIVVIAGWGCAGPAGRSVRDIEDTDVRFTFVPTTINGCTDLPAPGKWYEGSPGGESWAGHATFGPHSEEQVKSGRELARLSGLPTGTSGLIINGRVIGPFHKDSSTFSKADVQALISYEKQKRLDPVLAALKDTLGEEMANRFDMRDASFISRLSSVIARAYLPDGAESLVGQKSMRRSQDYRKIPGNYSSVIVGDEEKALFQFGVLLDPLSENAQTWSAILETLAEMPNVSIRLQLNPVHGISEMPLKRFYRYSLSSSPSFEPDTGEETSPSLSFRGLPESTLLTLALDVPHAWQAFPKESIHDLDNLRLADLKPSARERGVSAVFQLDNLIVEGHAREGKSGAPPRGLQLDLKNPSTNERTDTLVMANLGYHQLKANPGVWEYTIREGRSAEVFELEDLGLPTAASGILAKNDTVNEITVTSLEGLTIFPKFNRRAGMEGIDLLSEEAEQTSEKMGKKANKVFSGVMDRVQSIFGGKSKAQITEVATTANKGADINIFTVASGLLYERMAMIMILSVLRHTESSVKFWFINNFLSPSFKAFIPHLAAEYGFQYELITYTWPGWLRSQREKQRTIWGYKILFLDVLFPLELDRVIFVDSDQIVRTDLKQLVDMDLQGAPYAYAPMGDDREDMENYRFWKTGYWKDHLRGRPYHISALYVIDLDRFRQIAAGDRLRGQYQGLSADPGSLANLDQDLPNNMQTSLPIHTLDKSWLWCETWCSDEALAEAKTIDLCNNPKTHEPKLARAKRLIPEWTVYDQEIAALAARIASSTSDTASSTASEGERGVEDKVDTGALAFQDEAGQLQQARQQQVEFVEEGTGSAELPRPDEQAQDGPARPPKDEL